MDIKKKDSTNISERASENFSVHLTDSLLYDRLHILSTEYSLPVEFMVNVAVSRLVDDVDFVRSLRTGNIREV